MKPIWSWYKNTILVLMIISFISLGGTGILKHRRLMSIFSVNQSSLPLDKISALHDLSGLIFLLLVILHLILQRRWFVYIWHILTKGKTARNSVLIAFGILIGIGLYKLTRTSMQKTSSEDIKKLQEVEIKEYEGEDLSSFTDFRENSIKGPQYIDKDRYELKISGLVENEKTLSYEEVLAYNSYEKVVTLHCVEGWSAKILWEGVLVEDLIHDANPSPTSNTVIFRAYDGYSTSLPLDFILENDILLAYEMNGLELPPERGFPFQVVAEQKWGYKWAKWVTEIEISDDQNFRGYWEDAGYNQDADIDGPIFEK